jgi:alkanesulfonate monooxygenase SsuD/methylene tetrahydromethanopterin reductase-like flavin-dependent oxidoreductase (luciferase family)
MQFGVQLHPELGADAVIQEAQRADALGYDSVWLYDHLMNWAGVQTADFPLETLTLAAAIGASTRHVRISWGVLNLGFYNPAVLAKALATIDLITHGRVICTAGSGWFKEESEAYNVPMIQDHDERSAAAYEAVTLIKELWAHPAPETTTFTGKYFRTNNLPFQPAPYQRQGPPIWIGGESEVTQKIVRDHASGWVLLQTTPADLVKRAMAAPDWPSRPTTIVKTCRVIVGESRADVLEAAQRTYAMRRKAREAQIEQPGHPLAPMISFDEFIKREIVGTPDECIARIADVEAMGFNYVRLAFDDPLQLEAVARLILPHYAGAANGVESPREVASVAS